jgi:hypothetical protein
VRCSALAASKEKRVKMDSVKMGNPLETENIGKLIFTLSGNVARVRVQDKSVLTSIEDAITKAGYITKVQWMKENINI